jgi:hypothetical protein
MPLINTSAWFSHLIWVGDLNYRIPLPDAEVKQLARAGTYDRLLEYDQVRANDVTLIPESHQRHPG